MNRTNAILTGLLLVQAALIGWSTMNDDAAEGFVRSLVVSDLVAEAVTEVTIDDGKDTVLLQRSGPEAPWLVASAEGWRADDAKVDRTLGEVLGLETSDLVSTTENHYVDLKVADTAFERKLTLKGAGGTKEVFFGTSAPGSGVHVRRSGATEVFAVRDFASYKLSTGSTSWIDRTYLALPRERVAEVTIDAGEADYAFARTDDAWTVSIDGAPPVAAAQDGIDSILGKLERMTLSEVVGTGPPAPAPGEVQVTATVTAGDDGPARTVSLRFVPKPEDAPEDGEPPADDAGPERWFVRADTETHTVEVGRWAVRPLVEVDPAKVVAEVNDPPAVDVEAP